ncbi:MAG: serine/threonine-protein kinase [bacterium]
MSASRYCPACDTLRDAALTRCPLDGTRLVDVSNPDDLIGCTLEDRYVIRERIGGGGMGVVYRARQIAIDRDVAVKVVSPHLVSRAETARRFLREARLSGRIGHPHVVAVLDFGRAEAGFYYLVTEYIAGRTLRALIDGAGALAPDRAIGIAAQICDALAAAHGREIVHRDLKPSNVMVLDEPAGRDFVKVLDFGLARSLDAAENGSSLTSEGVLMGTPAYMSPEQAQGLSPDHRGDLYSLGCLLYEMLAGETPFAHVRSLPALALHHVSEPPPPLPASVPPALAALVMRLLAKPPDARPPSAPAVRAALEAAAAAASVAPAADPAADADPALEPAAPAAPTPPTEPAPPVAAPTEAAPPAAFAELTTLPPPSERAAPPTPPRVSDAGPRPPLRAPPRPAAAARRRVAALLALLLAALAGWWLLGRPDGDAEADATADRIPDPAPRPAVAAPAPARAIAPAPAAPDAMPSPPPDAMAPPTPDAMASPPPDAMASPKPRMASPKPPMASPAPRPRAARPAPKRTRPAPTPTPPPADAPPPLAAPAGDDLDALFIPPE